MMNIIMAGNNTMLNVCVFLKFKFEEVGCVRKKKPCCDVWRKTKTGICHPSVGVVFTLKYFFAILRIAMDIVKDKKLYPL